MAGPYLKLKVGVEGTVLPVAEGDWGFVSWEEQVNIETASVFSRTGASSVSIAM